jgi:hypothetical protein
MAFFSRSKRRQQPLLTATPADLRRLGVLAFGGEDVHPPGITGIPTAELDSYAMAYQAAAGYPPPGSPTELAAIGQFFDELVASAEDAGAWGFVGAICVGWNCAATEHRQDPRYLNILDRGLDTLRTDGVAYTAIPPFAMERWTSLHGYGGSEPTGWPSSLENVTVPSPNVPLAGADLAEGEARKMAQAPAAPQNMIYAERRPDGMIHAVIEGPDPESGALRRWDWDGVSSPAYPGFLRELGERIITHQFWVCDDLLPYIPCRPKSRETMRIEARSLVVP